jgi:GTPase-activating protein SAC7
VGKALLVLNGFVRDVREARLDVDGISRELHSLQSVLDLLKEDAGLFPSELAEQTPEVLVHCKRVVDELDECMSMLNSDKLSRQEKRKYWISHG